MRMRNIFYYAFFISILLKIIICALPGTRCSAQVEDVFDSIEFDRSIDGLFSSSEVEQTAANAGISEVLSREWEGWILDQSYTKAFERHFPRVSGKLEELLVAPGSNTRMTALALIARYGIVAESIRPRISKILNDPNAPRGERLGAFVATCMATPDAETVLDKILLTDGMGRGFFDLNAASNQESEVDFFENAPGAASGIALEAIETARFLKASGHTWAEVPALLECCESGSLVAKAFALIVLGELAQDARAAATVLQAAQYNDPDLELLRILALANITRDRVIVEEEISAARISLELRDIIRDRIGARLSEIEEMDRVMVESMHEDPETELLILKAKLLYGRGGMKREALRAVAIGHDIATPIVNTVRELCSDPDPETKWFAEAALKLIVE